jgi:hypothetical protein
MSTTRTLTPLVGGGTGGAIAVGDYVKATAGTLTVEQIRNNEDIAAYLMGHMDLGGDERGILSAAYVPVNGARTFDLNATSMGGVTLEAVVFYYTASAATAVQVRVRNVTDSSDAASGTSSVATTVTREVLTLTMAAGIKTYRLDVTGADALNQVYAWGYLRLRVVPA